MNQITELLLATQSSISAEEIITNLIMTFLFSLVIYVTYRFTYTGVLYSRKFNLSIVMITVVTAIVMIVIGSNMALSLGMVGALSIVRFRTAIKDPRDTAFVFWGIATGLASGTGNHLIALIGCIIVCIIMFVMSINIAWDDKSLLVVRANGVEIAEITKIVAGAVKNSKTRTQNISGDHLEMIFEIRCKKGQDAAVIQQLKELEGVESIHVLSQSSEMIG